MVGSQCDAMPRLAFLPDLAADLHAVLTDPRLGACTPALEDGGLLHDPSRTELLDALEQAFVAADRDQATLLLAFIGHGIARGGDYYFLARDAPGQGRAGRDVHLSQHLKELLRDSPELDGLLVLLDTCHAGTNLEQAATWAGQVGLGGDLRRYELLSATGDRAAYDGAFSRTIVSLLQAGVPDAGTTIDARYLRDPLLQTAAAQRPQRLTVDGGGWAQTGDEGLWLAHNAARQRDGQDDRTATDPAWDRVVELTAYLQPTPTLDRVVAAARDERCVVVTGPRGSGKSTLAAALARPSAAREHVPAGFVAAIAFAAAGATLADLAGDLGVQLAAATPGFRSAAKAHDAALSREEREGLDALRRQVIGPLRRLGTAAAVRLVIDALDELPPVTQQAVIAAIQTARDTPGVRFILTARPSAPRPAGAHSIDVSAPGDEVIAAYYRQRGVPAKHHPLLVAGAGGSWLHAYLLAEQALRPDFTPDRLAGRVRPALVELYEAELLAAGAGDRHYWQRCLRPVLAVLAVAGAGPVMPLPLLIAASSRLDGPATVPGVRDVLVRLSGLAVRSRPGTPDEHVGLFHASLTDDYLLHHDTGVQFPIDSPADAHAAIAGALDQLAPGNLHDPADPLHRYALRAEPDHRWGHGDADGVIASLRNRPMPRARDERERWHRWTTTTAAALGSEHPATLTVRHDLAFWTGEGGRGGRPRRLRRAATDPGAAAGRGAPRHPRHPPQPRPLG